MEPMVSTSTGMNQWLVDTVHLTFFRIAAASAAWPEETVKTFKYDATNVSTMIAS